MTINKQKLKELFINAEKGDKESIAVIVEVLRPKKEDSVDLILEKITFFIKIFYFSSLKYKDAHFHKEIDKTYAEQVHSLLNGGRPKYKGIMLIGYRESAKTSRVMMNETYMVCYLSDIMDMTGLVSADGKKAEEFNMGLFNILAFSNITKYFPDLIALESRSKKKESQTMSKFSTTTGVTYSTSSARTTTRGNVKPDIDNGEIEIKRPKKIIFDDIENEVTITSLATSEQIYQVMNASINGLDQIVGFWVLLGNYLSLRGNVAKFIKKYELDERVKIIMIPILDGVGEPTWEDKYCKTDKEENELAEQGIVKRSIESIKRDSENFDTEFLNNPRRRSVYFDDDIITKIKGNLVPETERIDELLTIEEPERTGVYIISADSAKGSGGDQSAFVIWRLDGIRYREVANYKNNKVNPENFAPLVANIGRKYNNALIIPENNYPGNEFIAFLMPIYNHIYKIKTNKVDDRNEPIYEYGVHTNLKTKPEMFLKAKRLSKDTLVEINSQILYNQFSEYPSEDILTIKQKDGSGGHFDLLMSGVIGLYKANNISETNFNDEHINNLLNSANSKLFGEFAGER